MKHSLFLPPNKSLKAFAALTGTVQTGAASHCRAGSSCPLALRYAHWRSNQVGFKDYGKADIIY